MEPEPRSVLLVDDERCVHEFLGPGLLLQGFQVTSASTTQVAIDCLRRTTFDAVLTDLYFDGMPLGRDVVRAARQLNPAAVVLMMTGCPQIDSAVSAIKDGATDYLIKPLDPTSVAQRLTRAIHEHRLGGELLGFAELVDILSALVANTIERVDPYTAGHGERTRRYCGLLARDLGLDAPTRERLELAAIAHDYGKIYLDDLSFLTKPGPLTAAEYREVQRHVVLGPQKLGSHERLRDVCTWIGEHHEKWDGTGYPSRKRGEETSLPGRILGVVEVFDSLATKRSYKEAWQLERVIDYFRDQRERAFDPDVLDCFLRKLEQHGVEWLRQPEIDRIARGLVA